MPESSPDITAIVIQICVCLLLFTAIREYAKKSLLPAEAWILISGIAYGLVTRYTDVAWLPSIELNPEVVFIFLLPLLIFSSGRLIRTDILKMEAAPIGFYAVIGVIATAFIIGLPMAYVLEIPVLHGLLLGSAVAATDPVAVGSIFQRIKIPEKLGLIVEGESLFNDGTTVVLFHLISGLVLSGAVFSLAGTGLNFVWSIAGAFILGVGLGWIAAQLLELWHEHHIFFPITITLILAFSTFILAEDIFHVSGVVAVLFAAIVFAKKQHLREEDEQTVENARLFGSFWNYISIIANSFLFFALGAETGSHPFTVTLLSVLAAILVMLASRSVVIYAGALILKTFGQGLPMTWQNILNIGGLRGAISAALILMIPHDYPYREPFLCLAFAMISFSLIIQPVLLQTYLKKVKLP
jgi:Na+:H+ antiporter